MEPVAKVLLMVARQSIQPGTVIEYAMGIADLETTLNTEPLQRLGIMRIRLRGEGGLLRVELLLAGDVSIR